MSSRQNMTEEILRHHTASMITQLERVSIAKKHNESTHRLLPLWPTLEENEAPIGSVCVHESLHSWKTHPDMNVFQKSIPIVSTECTEHEWCQYMHGKDELCEKCPSTLDTRCVYNIDYCAIFDPTLSCTSPWMYLLVGSDYILPTLANTNTPEEKKSVPSSATLKPFRDDVDLSANASLTRTDRHPMLLVDDSTEGTLSWNYFFRSEVGRVGSAIPIIRTYHEHENTEPCIRHVIIHSSGLIWIQKWFSSGIRSSSEYFKMEVSENNPHTDRLPCYYRHGPSMTWHPNGQIRSFVHFFYGNPIGRSMRWDENGFYTHYTMYGSMKMTEKIPIHPVSIPPSTPSTELHRLCEITAIGPGSDECSVTTIKVDKGNTLIQYCALGLLNWVHYYEYEEQEEEHEISDIWRWKYTSSGWTGVQMVQFAKNTQRPVRVQSYIYNQNNKPNDHIRQSEYASLFDEYLTEPWGCYRHFDVSNAELIRLDQYAGSEPYRGYFQRDESGELVMVYDT